jgi:site-specific DNA-methyltransferase (adenine-specific)
MPKIIAIIDPPYGISVVSNSGKVGASNLAKTGTYSKVVGDDTTDTAKKMYEVLTMLGVDSLVIWGGNYFTGFLPASPCWIVWDKRGDMNGNNFADCEMAWTSFDSPARIYKQVWSAMIKEGESDKRVHPTQKPIKILTDIIREYTDEGDVVIDLTLGSGSTLIACEQTNRICYGMEIDEKYCDVIRKRYAKFVGKEEEWEKITPQI